MLAHVRISAQHTDLLTHAHPYTHAHILPSLPFPLTQRQARTRVSPHQLWLETALTEQTLSRLPSSLPKAAPFKLVADGDPPPPRRAPGPRRENHREKRAQGTER